MVNPARPWSTDPILAPVAPWTIAASLDRRVQSAPVELLGRSNQPISCRSMLEKARVRSLIVNCSPEMPNMRPWRNITTPELRPRPGKKR